MHPGPTILGASAVRRAAQDLVVKMCAKSCFEYNTLDITEHESMMPQNVVGGVGCKKIQCDVDCKLM